jgi:hydrophobe/amphiphile efflux-1 (HAE1) family protein
MTLSEISIRRPVFAWMLMVGLIGFGALTFTRMGVSQLPDVDFPTISISLNFEGAAPEVMEMDVVDVVEDAIMSVEGVRSVLSSARNSSGRITVEFEISRNIDSALQDVQAKLAQVQRLLPREMDPPVVSKSNPEDQPILWLAVTSANLPAKDLMSFVRDRIKDQFTTIPGVGEIILGGYVDPALRVWVDDKKLEKYALSVTDVISTIQNEHSEPPAGIIESGAREFNVRTLGEARDVGEFKDLLINTRGGQPNFARIRLKDVARVEEGLADVRRLSRTKGVPAIGLGIRKQRGANSVAVARAVKAKMLEVAKTLPQELQIGVNFDTTKFIEESVSELNFTLILSAILTAVVCWGFLGSLSSTFNVVLAIPTSIVGAFTILYFWGFTLNTFTLLALSLAIGIVVDDATMVLENIVRHREMKKSREQAALDGSREITFAAVAATVSIIAIFLPVAFMTGIIGKFFFQFGVTMTVAVALSLLEALTLTPMRCAAFVDVQERTSRVGRGIETGLHRVSGLYRTTLAWALSHRALVMIGSLVFFAASMVSVQFLNKEFLPPEDQSRFIIRLMTPVGSSLSFTDEKVKEVEAFLATRPEVNGYFTSIGGFGGGDVNSGMAFVTMKPKSERSISQFELMDICRREFRKIKDVRAVIQDLSSRGFSSSRGFPVEFTVQGPDWDKLAAYSTQIMAELEKTGLVTDLDTDYQVGAPELRIIPDRDKAAARGVSISTIGQTVNALIGGLVVGRYSRGGHRIDIRLKLEEQTGASRAERVRSLNVRNNRGELIPLMDVVRLEEKPTLQVISRKERERAVTVFANVRKGASQQTALETVQQIAARVLPPEYYVKLSGSSQTFQESINSLFVALILGIFVAYMVLASQFNSFIDPVTVLMALPFSVSGAFVALLVSRQSLNIYSMIGLILLMGIVKKNSILLVEFTNQVREHARGGKSVRESLLEACPIRLRPILMTSIATIVGAIPPALAIGPGAETRIPMAVCVVGGVIVSTLLTLYVVPCAYSLFSRFERKKLDQVSGSPERA